MRCTRHAVIFDGMADGVGRWLGTSLPTAGLGPLDWVRCTDSASGRTTGRLDLGTAARPEATAPPTARVLAAEASAALRLDLPAISTAPPRPGLQLPGVSIWFWATGPRTRTATASIPGLSATVTATAASLDLHLDDGTSVHCAHLGTPYRHDRPGDAQRTSCQHAFRTRGRHAVTATVTWDLGWRGSDGSGGSLAPLPRTTAFTLDVSDGQAVTD